MRRHEWIIVVVIIVVIASAAAYISRSASISALPAPGNLETSIATQAKDYFIQRAASRSLPAPPAFNAATVAQGKALFGMDCVACHGQDGRHPSAIGSSMYPRAADLGSAQVQHLTRRELFWVISNGIRFTGMPGFAHINTDDEDWELSSYVHSLGHSAPAH